MEVILVTREDNNLVKKCKNGDEEAFRVLIDKYKADAVNVAYQMTNDPELAEDIAQEAFIRVYKYIGNFKGESKFFTWLYKIILNLCRDYFRRQPDQNFLSLEEPPVSSILRRQIPDLVENPEKQMEKKELQRMIKEALDTLSFEHRQVIVLKDLQGFTYREIAEIVDIPLGTVKSRLNTARKRLQADLVEKEIYIKSVKGGT